MKTIDRSLTAGLVSGLIFCLTVSLIAGPSVAADDRKPEPRERDSVEFDDRFEINNDNDDDRPRVKRSRRHQDRMRNRPVEPTGDFQHGERGREMDERQRREREMNERERHEHEMRDGDPREHQRHEHEMREREQREQREREMDERERREHEMRDGDPREHQRHEHEMREMEMHRRELGERERMEREQLEHREREEHQRHEAHQAIEREMLDLELRRKQLELRLVEMELEERVLESTSKMDEIAYDAIKQATRYMDATHAAKFFAETVNHVRSPLVKRQLRLQLAELYFQSKQPDRAVEQLRMLIVPTEHGGH